MRPLYKMLPCALCGIEVARRPSELKKSSTSGRVFCSREHYQAFSLGRPRKRKKTLWVCDHCGAEFPRHPSGRRGKHVYCGVLCAARARGSTKAAALPVGTTRLVVNGYVSEKTDRGWVKQHRLVMERKLGRQLYTFENVHHKNGDRADNTVDNLELWVTKQPPGKRPEDLVLYAREVLALYADFNAESNT